MFLSQLRDVGAQLDEDVYPMVGTGGVVIPSTAADAKVTLGKEAQHDRSEQTGSAAGPWERPARRQGEAGRPPAPDTAAPVVHAGGREAYPQGLENLTAAYPGAKIWHLQNGIWILAHGTLLPSSPCTVLLAVAISFTHQEVRAWGFWDNAAWMRPQWIGPRHTNFNNGAICAFEPKDGTWRYGESLAGLLDLYCLWALRHAHLEAFGRWPGHQAVAHPFERLLELRDGEYCGCGQHNKRYAECCKASDKRLDPDFIRVDFLVRTRGGKRHPPSAVVEFACTQITPPPLGDLWE